MVRAFELVFQGSYLGRTCATTHCSSRHSKLFSNGSGRNILREQFTRPGICDWGFGRPSFFPSLSHCKAQPVFVRQLSCVEFRNGSENREDHLARGRANVHLFRKGTELNPKALECFERSQ